MTLRRMLLGFAVVAAVAGTVSAKPPGLPGNTLPEGREIDPVKRDFYLAETLPPAEDSAPRRNTEDNSEVTETSLLGTLRDTIAHELTIPLGTAQPTSRAR